MPPRTKKVSENTHESIREAVESALTANEWIRDYLDENNQFCDRWDELEIDRTIQTEERFHSGKSVWQRWSDIMAKAKNVLFNAGLEYPKGQAQTDFPFWIAKDEEEFIVAGAHIIYECSKASFSTSFRVEKALLNGLNFPGSTEFQGVKFLNLHVEKVDFANSVSFVDCTFELETKFIEVRFSSVAWLNSASFRDNVTFQYCTFGRIPRFNKAKFSKSCAFVNTIFEAGIFFDRVVCNGNLSFSRLVSIHRIPIDQPCELRGHSNFSGTHFKGAVFFHQTRFRGFTSFSNSIYHGTLSIESADFYGEVKFESMKCNSAVSFKETSFEIAPSLFDSSFAEPPRVDNIRVSDPMKRWSDVDRHCSKKPTAQWMRWLGFRIASSPDIAARFRLLGKMATDSADIEKAIEFRAQQHKSKRFWEDNPLSSTKAASFWLGIFYEITSNFGRSVIRPFMALVFTTAFFTLLYTIFSKVGLQSIAEGSILELATATCFFGDSYLMSEAASLSMRNATIFANWDKVTDVESVYQCLNGVEMRNGEPIAIVTWPLSFASAVQTMLSGILFFLLGLGIRNTLRYK